MSPASDHAPHNLERFVHRELLQLTVLIAVAVAGFLVTRAVAASTHATSNRDAADWYRRGQSNLQVGDVEGAIVAFRRASVRNRTDIRYALALAQALAANHLDESARTALTALRESAPENVDINLELARLAAREGDVTEALRFYRNALYAPWPATRAEGRRQVRFELIRFLLANGQSARALPELLAAGTDMPQTADAHVAIGRLFVLAGDTAHALNHFQQALAIAPSDPEALTGAARSAVQLDNYALAGGYLRRLPPESDEVADIRALVDSILSNDPLENRLGAMERRRRLTSNLSYAEARLGACLNRRDIPHRESDQALQHELTRFAAEIGSKRAAPLEPDAIEVGVDLVARVASRAAATCGPETSFDRAMVRIGHRHAAQP